MLNLTAIAPQVEQMADYVAAREQFARALAAGTASLILANCAQPLGHDQKAALEKTIGAPVIEINFQTHFELSHPHRPRPAPAPLPRPTHSPRRRPSPVPNPHPGGPCGPAGRPRLAQARRRP